MSPFHRAASPLGWFTVFALTAAACGPGGGETPEEFTQRYLEAVRAGEFQAMAGLMHVDALREIRDLLDPLFSSPMGDEVARELLGLRSASETVAMSDTAVFVGFIRFVLWQNPELTEALRTAEMQILGHVSQGADTAHVVYRLELDVEGIRMSRMDVVSLRRTEDSWRALLTGDVSAVAAALRQMVEAQGRS